MAQTKAMVEACGYEYRPHPDVVPNSHKALEVTELARDRGLHEAVHTRLMDAYWSEGLNIADEVTLLALAADAGLDPAEAAEALADRRYHSRVADSTREANMVGVNAIPAFVLDGRLLLVGAHPYETFERAYAQLDAAEDSA